MLLSEISSEQSYRKSPISAVSSQPSGGLKHPQNMKNDNFYPDFDQIFEFLDKNWPREYIVSDQKSVIQKTPTFGVLIFNGWW